MQPEARMVKEPVQVRADGETKTLTGYAAVFNRETVIGDFFRETIDPGAFRSAVSAGDVRGLFNHDPNMVLGRTASGTMRLEEDETGLRYIIDPPDTTLGRDVMALVSRGDVTGSSFGFTVKRDSWTRPTKAGELPLRTIHEFDWLRDVGPVTFPAYEETTVQARDAAGAAKMLEAPPPDHTVNRARIDLAEAEC
jgi:HK97 family phage prohead protease